jgi:cytochrome bd-type quinol oxidase subunit 2
MIQKVKKFTVRISIVLLAVAVLGPGMALAATTPDLQGAACAGSDIKITADPSNAACNNVDDGAKTVNNLVATVINIFSTLIGIAAVIMIMVAGFRYITSGGKDDTVKSAKNTIVYALIGLVVVALAQIIVHFVLAKTSQAVGAPQCVAGKWNSGPDKGHRCP